LKYSNQPRKVRLTVVMIDGRLRPLVRRVLARMASRSLLRLFLLGQRRPHSKW